MKRNSVKQAYRDFLNTPEGVVLYRQFKRLLYARQDSLVQWFNNSILLALPVALKLNVRVCDIGGGDGGRITQICQFLHGKFKNKFHVDFIEQSALYALAFSPSTLKNFCRIKIHHSLFEKVCLSKRTYDLVFLIHSIFAFEDETSTEKVLSLRREGGTIVVISNEKNSFLGGLKRLVDEGYTDKRFEIDDLEKTLRKLGIDYQRRVKPTEWVIEKKEWKRDIGIILNWISLGRYDSFSRQHKKKIEAYVRSKGKKNGLRTFFKEEEVFLVIPSVR